MKNKRSKTTRRRRGTIIILVVAVLALLAVIGTIYIISARTERAAANAAATNVNMVLAERAAMNSVVEIIGNAMYDSAGNVGGYDATTGTYGTLAARNYDFPDSPPLNLANSALDLVDPATGATMVNSLATSMRGEPWLAPTLHNNSLTAFQTTAGDSYLTYNVFDPYTAKYDIFTPSATPPPGVPPNVVDDQTLSTVDPFVPANPSANPDGINPNTTQPPDAYWNLLPFSEASGIHYRYAIRILDTSRMANLNIGSVDDATAKGDTTGTYITSYDLAPAAGVITDGAFFNQLDNTGSNLARNLHISAAGRAGTSGIAYTDLASWQKQFAFHIEALLPPASGAVPFDLSDELELRSYGEYGTTYHARPAMGGGISNTLWPNTLSGDSNKSSASSTVIGNPARRNYTTYSFSRDIRPFADPTTAKPMSPNLVTGPFTLTPTDGIYPSNFPGFIPVGGTTAAPMNIWPPSPARINPNPDITSMNDNDAVFTIAAAATNMATAMTLSGYSGSLALMLPEIYAANYVAQRCNCYAQDTTITDGTMAYYLPHGPSFIDGTGICIRSRKQSCPAIETGLTIFDRNFGSANDVVTPRALPLKQTSLTEVYVGYAAQPFISEVAVEAYTWDKNAGVGTPQLLHDGVAWAVVLYNPYSQALSLQGFTLRYQGIRINLGTTAGGKNYVPANGYTVLYSPLNLSTTDNTPKVIEVPPTLLIQSQFIAGANMIQCLPAYNPSNVAAVTLERTYYDRSGNPQFYPIELYEFGNNANVKATPPAAITSAAGTVFCTWEKSWLPTVNPWAVTIGAPGSASANALIRNEGAVNPVSPTLGPPNPNVTVATAVTMGVHLYDRNFETAVTEGAAARKNFTSFTDFNHIMLTGSTNDETGTANQNHYSLTVNLAGNVSTVPAQFAGLAANDAFAAQIYFDFSPDAKIYSTLPASNPSNTYNDVDASAFKLLDCITFIDRVSDPTIDLLNLPNNGSKLDINKIRLPGKININTASGDVLRALPGIQLMANPNQVVANILAYRVRASTATPVTYNGTPSNKDYSAQANYPGVGFRSLAEVTIPIYDALGGRPPVDKTTVFDTSDASWSSIYNLCTVRSDTFVVYGYLEAVENGQNLANNNGNAWYSPTTSDNPTLGGPSLIRLSRLRWVAIVDRSFCNYPVGSPNFQMPRIVAIKDLPK